MQKTAIYPFDKYCICYIPLLLEKYSELRFVLPYGHAHIGKDVCSLDKRENIGLFLESNINKILNEIDILIIPRNINISVINEKLYLTIVNAALRALQMEKIVLYGKVFNYEDELMLKQYSKYCNAEFIEYDGHKQESEQKESVRLLYPKQPEAAVVFVGDLLDHGRSNSAEVAIKITNNMRQKGYKVISFIEPGFGQFLDFQNINDLITYDTMNLGANTIASINEKINKIDLADKPDLIIIQLPGNMLPLDNEKIIDGGLSTFIISLAIKPDAFVCCGPFNVSDISYIEKLNDSINGRFGYQMTCLHISNLKINLAMSYEDIPYEKLYLPVDYVCEYIKKSPAGDISLFCSLDINEANNMCDYIEKRLENNLLVTKI